MSHIAHLIIKLLLGTTSKSMLVEKYQIYREPENGLTYLLSCIRSFELGRIKIKQQSFDLHQDTLVGLILHPKRFLQYIEFEGY